MMSQYFNNIYSTVCRELLYFITSYYHIRLSVTHFTKGSHLFIVTIITTVIIIFSTHLYLPYPSYCYQLHAQEVVSQYQTYPSLWL